MSVDPSESRVSFPTADAGDVSSSFLNLSNVASDTLDHTVLIERRKQSYSEETQVSKHEAHVWTSDG